MRQASSCQLQDLCGLLCWVEWLVIVLTRPIRQICQTHWCWDREPFVQRRFSQTLLLPRHMHMPFAYWAI